MQKKVREDLTFFFYLVLVADQNLIKSKYSNSLFGTVAVPVIVISTGAADKATEKSLVSIKEPLAYVYKLPFILLNKMLI